MNMMKRVKREDGQGLVEYALVLVLVAVVVIVILTVLGGSVVFAYAQVLGGLNGDSMDDNAIILSSSTSMNGTTVCTATITDISFIVTDGNGDALTNQNVSATILANGVDGPTITGAANGNGVATAAGPVTASGSCPLTITLSD